MEPKRLVLLLVSGLGLLSAPAAADVARFDTAEITLRASRSFDGLRGTPNPFTDVELRAAVTAPDGRRFAVDGFFDGDGAGGAVGNVFKVRVFVDQPGTWAWDAESSDPGLDGLRGSFKSSGNLAGRFGRGPVVQNPQRPHSFKLQDGKAIFLLGKFLDRSAPAPLQWSHTFFSEALTEGDRRAMLDRHLGMKLNKLNIYLANKGDYGGKLPTTPWVGTTAANDKTRFDLRRWHLYERWVQELRRSGMVAHLWFFADDSGFGSLPDADRRRLIRYGMARLSSYANTFFTLVLEWEEGWSPQEVETHASYIQEKNPWNRQVGVHGQTGDFDFADAPWADYLDIQAGFTGDPSSIHELGLRNRSLAAKPLIQEEISLGEETPGNRQKSWAAFTAGAAGLGTGAGLAALADFAARVPFERMRPLDSLVTSGNAFALTRLGQLYALYLPNGGSVGLDLSRASGSLEVEWFNPRTGAWVDAPGVAGGAVRTFKAPQGGDWALYIHR